MQPEAADTGRQSPSRAASFGFAFEGIIYVLRTQPNTWIHGIISISVIGMGLWLGLSKIEWVLLVLAMGIVWTAEIMNTAIEAVVDLASPDLHPIAKVAKDSAAGGVLVSAMMAVIVGALVLGPPLLARVLMIFS